MKNAKRSLFFTAVILACWIPLATSAYAWNGNEDGTGIHADIANQTVRILFSDLSSTEPQAVRDNLAIVNQNINQLKRGACYPDYSPERYDLYQDHFWDPDTGHNFTYSASWYKAGKIDQTADTNISKFTALAINDWKKGNYADAVFELGEAMHFTGDLNQPYHSANITSVDSIGHVLYEKFADTAGPKYFIPSMGSTTADSIYSSAINSDPLSAWITNTDTYYGKIAKGLYSTKASMSHSREDWDSSIGIALPNAQKNSALLLYRFLNDVSGTVPACTSSFDKMQLVIKTADEEYAGTDDTIFYGFETSVGHKYEFKLDNPGNDFERNQRDTYLLTFPVAVDEKTITKSWLKKSNTLLGDDWKPENIKVIINGYVKQDVTLNKWLKGNTTCYLNTDGS